MLPWLTDCVCKAQYETVDTWCPFTAKVRNKGFEKLDDNTPVKVDKNPDKLGRMDILKSFASSVLLYSSV